MTLRWSFVAVLALSAVMSACGPIGFVVGVSPGDQQLRPTVVESDGQLFSDRVAIVDVCGVIVNAQKPGLLQAGENPVSLFAEQLAAVKRDRSVKAVILRLNTPGGAVTASDAMYREVRRFKAETGKPVVAVLMDVAASGGYYVACSADRIVAYPTSVTGSIGVIIQTITVKPALSRIGIEAEAITSGPNKDVGSPLSVMTDAQRAVLRKLVDDFYARFVAVVREARPNIPAERFQEMVDGRVVSGEEAVAAGLADELGDLQTGFDVAKRMAGIERADLVIYRRPLEYVGSPYAMAPAGQGGASTQVNFAQFNFDGLAGLDTPVGFYYLWRPDLP
jgi:protease-4